MAWYIMPVHHVAQIHPTLFAGTNDNNYPFSNVRTLNHRVVGDVTTAASLVRIDFDRLATAGGGSIDTFAVFNSNLGQTPAGTVEIWDDTVSNFATKVSLITAKTAVDNMFYRLDTASTKRYIRWEWAVTTGTAKIGVISLGRSYKLADFGPQILTEQGSTVRVQGNLPDEDTERILRSFRQVDRTVAETILSESRSYWIKKDNNVIDGLGGSRAVILGDTSSNLAYFGKAIVRIKPWGAGFTEVFVDMIQERQSTLT